MGIPISISLTLALLSLLGPITHGLPTKGRYMGVRCRPDSQKANCEREKDKWMDLPVPNRRSLADNKRTKDQSDDGSGTGQLFNVIGSADQKDGHELGAFQPEEASTDLDGSPEIDYSDFVFPQKVYRKNNLPFNQEFQEENLIL